MGLATIRRWALVAVLVLLVPVWGQPAVVVRTDDGPRAALIRLAPGYTPAEPAMRRHVGSGWWLLGSRPESTRALVALAVVALLSLLRSVPWSTLDARRSAPSLLARRRHVIALRAPPLPTCA